MKGSAGNDGTVRNQMWHRYDGDEWAAYDALPRRVRLRMTEHAYDAWAVNTLIMWRQYRRRYASSVRAERAVLGFLDRCEALERQAFAATQRGGLAHDAAGVSVLRYRGPQEPANRALVDGPARAG